MHVDFLFEMGECPVDGIRRFGDVDGGMVFESEKKRKRMHERCIRSSDATMGVLPPSRLWVDRALFEEGRPSFMPCLEGVRERRPGRVFESHGDPAKLDAGLKHRMPCEVSRHGFEHVELAVLHGVALRFHLCAQPFFAVTNHGSDAIPMAILELVYPCQIVEVRFFPDEIPQEIPFPSPTAKDHHAIRCEIGRVHDQDDGFNRRKRRQRRHRCRLEFAPDLPRREIGRFRQIVHGLALEGIGLPKMLRLFCISSGGLKDVLT